ncbi:MAG: DNA polymerase IV, partial [Candidatus Hodarchaeota archaeon]
MEWNHVILHCDLDSFFASVHIKNHPFLQDYPVIIGADPHDGNGRGVVSTCSYKARSFGLHSAMPISQAYKMCPHGVYICSGSQISFPHYREESNHVMTLLQKYSEKFQQAGLDEAYLDVSTKWPDYGSTPVSIAEKIQTEIHQKLALSVSIGIAETKSIAKIASDLSKPRGITVVHNSDLEKILYHLPVRKIVGVGKKTEHQLQKRGLVTIGDIASLSREKAYLLLGDHGLYLRKVALGINYREVGYSREGRKSIGSERTFSTDQYDWRLIEKNVQQIVSRLVEKLNKHNLLTRTVSLKIRFQGFE